MLSHICSNVISDFSTLGLHFIIYLLLVLRLQKSFFM